VDLPSLGFLVASEAVNAAWRDADAAEPVDRPLEDCAVDNRVAA
jgi:hypothetical protein